MLMQPNGLRAWKKWNQSVKLIKKEAVRKQLLFLGFFFGVMLEQNFVFEVNKIENFRLPSSLVMAYPNSPSRSFISNGLTNCSAEFNEPSDLSLASLRDVALSVRQSR